jgi:hypothetical protein
MTLDQIVAKWTRDRLEQAKLSIDIARKNRKWALMVEEIHSDPGNYGSSTKFTEAINWSVTALNEWPNCVRMSYDTWYFKTRYEAEKFSTLFNLKWAT